MVSPHRAKRPWLGQVGKRRRKSARARSRMLSLSGQRARAGIRNPPYTSTFVFQNDFAALLPDVPHGEFNVDELLVAESERGLCRVICFSPRHDLSLAGMSAEEILPVVDLWVGQTLEIPRAPEINFVQIFRK